MKGLPGDATTAATAPVLSSLEPSSPALRETLLALREVVPEACLVGGAVRDILRGVTPVDLDVVTRGDALRSAEAVARRFGGSFFPLDDQRGQFRVALPAESPVTSIDVSPLTSEDIQADLRQRDFTLNAMAATIEPDGGLSGLLDPLGGAADIEARLVRMTSRAALTADPLRLLRAARIAIETDYEVETETAAAVRELAPLLARSAAERQRGELTRILETPRAGAGVRLMDSLGLLDVLLPELMPARGVDQPGGHHFWDVFNHSIETVAALDTIFRREEPIDPPASPMWSALRETLDWFGIDRYLDETVGGGHSRAVLTKLAGLLHDISKPETKSFGADGRVHFLGHPELGANKTTQICERLRFSNREVRFVSLLVEEHLRPTQLAPKGQPPSQRALYRFFRDLGDAAPACLFLMLADGAATAGPRITLERWQAHVDYVSYVLARGRARMEAAGGHLITGNDLIADLNLTPGPELGRVLAAVDEAAGAGEVSTKEEALELARRIRYE